MRPWFIGVLAAVALLAAAFFVSPWPSVYVIRYIFDKGAEEASAKLEKHVPSTVTTQTVAYDDSDRDAVLDVYRPTGVKPGAPVLVWIHGGGFISGRRKDIANHLKVIAGHGFIVVNVDYTIAPEATYPTPLVQLNKALSFLATDGKRIGLDPSRLVLAGDSAGAQIAAQTAAMIVNPDYARLVGVTPGATSSQLSGVLLFCGVYEIANIGTNGGILGWFVQSTGWAYSGKRDWRRDEHFATISIAPHLTEAFPPAFVSAGNADPLGPQSVAMAAALKAKGVKVEELFFAAAYEPALGHEYQFDIDTEAGRLALDRTLEWLSKR